MSKGVIDVLDQLQTEGKHEHLFVNRKTGNRYVAVHKVWKKIRTEADLPDLRIHDLRHSMAAYMASANVNLRTIQLVLGHQSYAQTERYAHVANGSLQDAADKASKKIMGSMPK